MTDTPSWYVPPSAAAPAPVADSAARKAIKQIYADWFGRTPSDAALDYWASLIERGESPARVQGMMLSTEEGKAKVDAKLGELYQTTFGRAPDAAGLAYWKSRVVSGVGLTEVARQFQASPEAIGYQIPPPTRTQGTDPGINQPPALNPVLEPTAVPSTANFATLQLMLNQYGLGDLYDTAVNLITDDASPAEIELALRGTDQFRERFAVIFDREQSGRSAISPAEVIAYEANLEAMISYMGYPDDGRSVQELTRDLMANDVSLNEVSERMTAMRTFARQVLDDPNQDTEAVQRLLDQGATLYDVANFALDPTKTLDQVMRRLEAAAIANEAGQTGFDTTADEAMNLAREGINAQQAQQGFQALQAQQQIVQGINNEGQQVTREEQLAYVGGQVQGQQAIERARSRRLAEFDEGGSFARDEDGFGGLR